MQPTPNDTIAVRLAELDDAPEIKEQCLPMASVAAVREQIEENMRGLDSGKRMQLVACVDGIVVGTVVLIRDEHPLRIHRGGLFSLVVAQTYQGRGIARRLVKEVCRRASILGIKMLEISCRASTPAEKVYRRLGFAEYGRLPRGLREPWGDQRVFDEVFFYLPVGGRPSDGGDNELNIAPEHHIGKRQG